MSLRKLRRACRGLFWVVGSPDNGTPCMDCRDHPARVRVMRRTKRDGSSYDMESHTFLHLCETCTMMLVEQLLGMIRHMTHERVDTELSHTTAERAKLDRDTGTAAKHDRRVRARTRRLKHDNQAHNARAT